MIKLFLRLVGGLSLLLATVVLLGCLAGIVGIWTSLQSASGKIEALTQQLDAGFQRASASAANVKRSSTTIRSYLESGKMVDLATGSLNNQQVSAYLRGVVNRLSGFSEATGTLASLLRSAQEMPFSAASGIDKEKVDQASEQASALAAKVQNLNSLLGTDDKEVTESELVEALNESETALQKCEAILVDWQADFEALRTGLPVLAGRVVSWLRVGAIVLSLVLGWIGICQISLMVHAWKWCRGSAHSA